MNEVPTQRVRYLERKIIRVATESVRRSGSWSWTKRGSVRFGERGVLERLAAYLGELENPVLVDVGANAGMYVMLGVIVPDLRIIAFEPNPEAFRLLEQNVEINGLTERVQMYPVALGEQDGESTLKVPGDANWWGQATLADELRRKPFRQHGATEVPVLVRRLDDLVDAPVDFIKIDTEGYELSVLKGAQEVLAACRPGVQIEIELENLREFGLNRGMLFDFLIGARYEKFSRVGVREWWAFPK